MRRGLLVAGLGSLAATACVVTPLTNKIAVGDDPFVIVVGEGEDGNTDLFAGQSAGGAIARFTFNRAVESRPRLAPGGKAVAFLRRAGFDSTGRTDLVVFDLTTATERSAPLPDGIARVEALGWSPDGATVYVRAERTLATPSAKLAFAPVGADSAAADRATHEQVGDPPAGTIDRCGAELCVRAGADSTPLGGNVTDAIRWGADSIATVIDGRLEIRPLGRGHVRTLTWSGAPAHLRQPTYDPGSTGRSAR